MRSGPTTLTLAAIAFVALTIPAFTQGQNPPAKPVTFVCKVQPESVMPEAAWTIHTTDAPSKIGEVVSFSFSDKGIIRWKVPLHAVKFVGTNGPVGQSGLGVTTFYETYPNTLLDSRTGKPTKLLALDVNWWEGKNVSFRLFFGDPQNGTTIEGICRSG